MIKALLKANFGKLKHIQKPELRRILVLELSEWRSDHPGPQTAHQLPSLRCGHTRGFYEPSVRIRTPSTSGK